jgi:glutamine synthetase
MSDSVSPTIAANQPLPDDHPFDEARIASVAQELRSTGVEQLMAVFVDVNGIPKAKATPIEAFEKLCKGAELYTVGAVEGLGLAGPHEDECATLPDLDSLIIYPWDSSKAWLASSLYYHQAPYAGDPRNIFAAVADKAAAMGYSLKLGIEPEFYIFKEHPDTGEFEPITDSAFNGPNACYDVELTHRSDEFLDPFSKYLKALDWGLYSFDQECGKGQHEFDFGYTDALQMCDRFIFFRHMVKQVAHSIGAVATFMPKPFANDFRSGAHFNMSLWRGDSNIFERSAAGESGEIAERYGIDASDTAYYFVGGLLKHAAAITAVTCSTYNSYQGLIAQGELADFSWAPVLQTYGNNNRSSMLRLPMNRPCVENRAVDMAVNPYLAAAIQLAAGLDGINNKIDPGNPFNNDLYQLNRTELKDAGINVLPPTLLHALEAFETDLISEAAFGSFYKEVFLQHKRKEWDRCFYSVSSEQRDTWLTYI